MVYNFNFMKKFEIHIPNKGKYEEMQATFMQSDSYTPEEYANSISEFLTELYENLPHSGAKKLVNDKRIQRIVKNLSDIVD